MTGYTVHTGSNLKFTSGWDRIFEETTPASAAGKGAGKKAAAKKSAKKSSAKKASNKSK